MKKKVAENHYTFRLNSNTTQGGFFRIYQGRNGSIQLCMGNTHTALALKNIQELGLESTLYELEEFDTIDYNKYYKIPENREGDDDTPDFLHSDLSSDFIHNSFPLTVQYKTFIDQTQCNPECFQLTIQEEDNDEIWEYLYDNKNDAFADQSKFYTHLKIFKR